VKKRQTSNVKGLRIGGSREIEKQISQDRLEDLRSRERSVTRQKDAGQAEKKRGLKS
jgi:hypothetical protein